MKRIEKVYEIVLKICMKEYKEIGEIKGISASEIADILGLQRTNVSSDLNKLFKDGRIEKLKGKPVLYKVNNLNFLIKEEKDNVIDDDKDIFSEIIGENLSLKNAVQQAKAKGNDVVIIDTAGRLHNKVGLMNELKKIKDVMKKVLPTAPDEVLLVLDGSTGQNAFEQAKQFSAVTQITSLAITKLDGTAKGGVVIGISDQLKVPVKYIGLGEKMEDLQLFNRKEFVDSLF